MRGRGVFYSKLVIPAQAGIQKCFAEKAGCLPTRLCRNPFWSLRVTAGSVAIFMLPATYEIASVVSLPRNDIATQPLGGEARVRSECNSFRKPGAKEESL